MEPLSVVTAACVVGAAETEAEKLGSYLLHPLWSGGCGIPSFNEMMSHDEIRVSQLCRLQCPQSMFTKSADNENIIDPRPTKSTPRGLGSLLEEIWSISKKEKESTARRHAKINSLRCQSAPFAYPEKTLKAVHVDTLFSYEENIDDLPFSRIFSTPTEFLRLRRSQQQRAENLDELIKKFVFCVPKAGSRSPELRVSKVDLVSNLNATRLSSFLMEPLETHYRPFRNVEARLTSFFPDKKLVQFDAGKLQAMAILLRELKRGGHRALIFTQMSKMLDILESFLNLHGHTYLRLDGGTGVEKRQRLMDRFNNDEKVFCFILSTRSGGLGINLTGADTVIFFDSDWNPAMDAQAQDRAHRIGQTRDVHIYRLVTEHSIEENILTKAKQKRHLDFLVMDEGKFDTKSLAEDATKSAAPKDEIESNEPDVLTTGGLRDILGIYRSKSNDKKRCSNGRAETDEKLSKEQLENAMASLEDEDDVLAMKGAQKEAAEELQEFDENAQSKESDAEGEESQDEEVGEEKKIVNPKKVSSKKRVTGLVETGKQDEQLVADKPEDEIEKEFAVWQNKVGVDTEAISASLTPTERYALRFKEEVDPFYSIHFYSEEQRMDEVASVEEDWNVEEIEREKEAEEKRAIEDGDLLATQPLPEMLPRQRQLYLREKSRLKGEKFRRKLTGENWGTKVCSLSMLPFFFNSDTGEARWDKPQILIDLEADTIAHEKKWNAMPMKPLVHVMKFFTPFPDRMCSAAVCRQWRTAANDASFIRHVFPVEMGALALDPDKLDHNHYRTIADAIESALPGDTIGMLQKEYDKESFLILLLSNSSPLWYLCH